MIETLNNTHNITIGLWNANGLQTTTVADVLSHCRSFSILIITETWILPPTTLLTDWTQFHTYGTPVRGTYRGSKGIVALVNPNCPLPVTHLLSQNPYTLSLQFGPLRLACFYLPPSLSTSQAMAVLDSIPLHRDTLLCGDFNARFHQLLGDSDCNPRGTNIKTWLEDRALTILNASLAYGIPTFQRMMNEQTHHSIIDLFITNNIDTLQDPTMTIYSDLTLGSDHCLLSLNCTLDTDPDAPILDDAVPKRKTWQLSKLQEEEPSTLYQSAFFTNALPLYNDLQYAIDYLNDCPSSCSKPDFDYLYNTLCKAIYDALDTSIGTKPRRPLHWNKYWTPALQTSAEYRNYCYKQWRQSYGVPKIRWWTEYKQAQKQFRRDVLVAKRLSWRDYCHSLEVDFNKAVSQVKYQKRKREQSGTFTHPDGSAAAATAMVNHLKQVYNGEHLNGNNTPIDFSSDTLPHTDALPGGDTDMFSADHIEFYIKLLPQRKAPGVDHLRAEMLRPIKTQLAAILSLFFQLCWAWGEVPSQLRHAQVFPIFKKGDPTSPGNYRPISLTSIIRKLLEMVIQSALKRYSPKLDVAQGGFRTRRSALDQALCLHDLIQDYYNQHSCHYPIIAFLDIKAAYDTVDRNIIWKALRLSGTPLPLLGLLQHLFNSVTISVLIGNHTSSSFSPSTGVLQGSVLSPLLYSIYINNLPSMLRAYASPTTTTVAVPADTNDPTSTTTNVPINSLLFADDVAIFGSKQEVKLMLEAAARHSLTLGYRWNPLKCAVLNHPIGRTDSRVPLQPLKLYGVALPQVNEFVYLGVPFIKSGISGASLAKIRSSGSMAAMSTLNKMGAHRSGFPVLLSARLYKTFIRPKFEYGLAIAKLLKKDLLILEKLQDRCLRLIIGGHPSSSTTVLKIMTNIPSVSWRVDVLVTKYCIRSIYLPANCLLILLQESLPNTTLLQLHLKKNRLFATLPVPLPPGIHGSLKTLLHNDRQQLFDSFMSTTPQVLAKACRTTLMVDPVLYIPASRTDRSRLIRWRIGWLPGKPHDCVCTTDRTSRRHFFKYECNAIPSDLYDNLPPPPPGVHPIDHAICMLPVNSKQYCDYWPSLLSLLWYVECCVLPTGYFPEDLDPGAIWRDSICYTNNTDAATELS